MATNFEFYKDEIVDALKDKSNPTRCAGRRIRRICKDLKVEVEECDNITCGECLAEVFEFLAQEHIEKPKLTKRERAFCEAVQTGWIARDKNGILYWYGMMPETKGDMIWMYYSPNSYQMFNMERLFKFIAWEDEKPWAVEDLLKLEVIEENPTSSNKVSNEVQEDA